MINSSVDFGTAVRADNRDFLARLSVNGTPLNVDIAELTITKGSCGGDEFGVGSVFSSMLTAEVRGLATNIKGSDIQVEIGLMVNGAYEYITLGYFTVTNVENALSNSTITAYGHSVSKTGAILQMSGTQSIANIRNAISSASGVNVTIDTMTTSYVVGADINGLTVYEALQTVASLVGGYVIDCADGSIAIKKFSTTSTLSVDGNIMNEMPVIEEQDFTVTGAKITAGETEFTYGTVDLEGENEYMTNDIFTNLFVPNIVGYSYRPAELPMSLGDPRIEGNDVVTFTDEDNNTYTVPCHEVIHTYDGGFSTKITALKGTQQSDSISTTPPISGRIKEQEKQIARVDRIASNTDQYFWFTPTGTDTGAHITEVPQDEFTDSTSPNYHSGGNLLARSNGIAVRDGMTELATFGANGATIGITDGTEAYVEFDYHSMRMIDKEGTEFFHISDLRNESGIATLTVTDTLDTQFYALSFVPLTIVSVKVDGATATYVMLDTHTMEITSPAISGNETIEVVYTTNSSELKAYTLGTRNSSANIGAYSYAEGVEVEASGDYSHAQGYHTKATGNGQTAIGYWNKDTNCAFVIGNGSGENNRSNAFEVKYSGAIRGIAEVPSPTIYTTTGELVSKSMRRFGNVVQLDVVFRNTSSVASGANVYVATMSNFKPAIGVTGATFFGKHILGATLGTNGTITVRNASPTAVTIGSSYTSTISFTYIIDN